MNIPRARLAAADLYHLLDWVSEGWDDGEMWVNRVRDGRVREVPAFITELRIGRLRDAIEQIGEPYRAQALLICDKLRDAHRRDQPRPHGELAALRTIVSSWDKSRPQLITCGFDYGNGHRCTVTARGEDAIAEHRRVLGHEVSA